MSYTIEYNKQFIRSESGFTPCWLAGDNNVTEPSFSGRERGVRSWNVYHNLLGVTEQVLLDDAQKYLNRHGEHWKKNGKWVDDAGLIRWLRNGCKNAATIEEILAVNRMRAIRCYVSVWDKEYNSTQMLAEYISTTEAFDKWILAVRDLVVREEGFRKCYPIVDFGAEHLIHPHRDLAEKPEQVILRKGTGRNAYYLTAVEPDKSHSWSRNIKDAMVLSYKDAEHLRRNTFDSWVQQARIISATAKDAPYDAVIRFVDGSRAGSYVAKRTSRKLYTSLNADGAHRYRDRKAAEQALKKLQGPFQHVGNMVVIILER